MRSDYGAPMVKTLRRTAVLGSTVLWGLLELLALWRSRHPIGRFHGEGR